MRQIKRFHAADQKISKVSGDFCGGNENAAVYDGTYQIVARKNNRIISTLPIGQREFIAGTPHDGLHIVTYQPTGEQFLRINKYGSCNGDYSSFYAISSENQVVNIPFVGNGTSTPWVPDGFSKPNTQINGTFCGYSNAIGYNLCATYQYKNYTFTQIGAGTTQ
jgi:hypothetical protein